MENLQTSSDDEAIKFAKKVLSLLFMGHVSAVNMIDWKNFKTPAANVGARYKLIPTKSLKEEFCSGVVKGFARRAESKMEEKGKTVSDIEKYMTDWRIIGRGSEHVVGVTAVETGYTMKLTITRKDNELKLKEIS
jgi:hypothetical protein